MTVPLSGASPRSAAPVQPRRTSTKVVHFMRHGITEMNVYLSKNPYRSWGFKDPLLYDTRLTPEGADGARRAASLTIHLNPAPEVLLVSPLTRALQTASLAFPTYDGRIEVEPLARERVWLSSDCGRSPDELKADFPDGRYTFDHLPSIWWYNGDSSDPKRVILEPERLFKARVQELKKLLLARPESSIAMVAHWGLLSELTGDDYENCQIQSYEFSAEDGFKAFQ